MRPEAILFPGQGAQFPGMGRAWTETSEEARAAFEEADELLGFALSEAIWKEGDDVHRTDLAQPGIFVTSVAILRTLARRGLDQGSTRMCAGLSLGEYTALHWAGAISFAEGLRLVRLRGEAMQAASERTPSSMTSLLGADLESAEKLAAIGAAHGICAVANRNAPGQIVLSGELAALDAVEAAAREHGVRRAVRLSVAGGFHSECMRPAARELAGALEEVEVRAPRYPVVSNVTARPVEGPEEIRRNLAEQVCSPVLWEASMRWALDAGIESFLEPGPGSVLQGLLKKCLRESGARVDVRSVETPEDLA